MQNIEKEIMKLRIQAAHPKKVVKIDPPPNSI